MDALVEVAGFELLVIELGLRAEGVEGEQPFGVPGAAALFEEFLDVVGVFEVAVALVAAGVGGDEVVGVIEAEAVGEGVEGELLGGVEVGHGVAVGVQDDAAAVGDPNGAGDGDVGGHGWQRAQGGFFGGGEEFGGLLAGFLVVADVGDGVEPVAAGGVDGAEAVREVESGEQVFLHVADEVFDAAFFVGFAHGAGAGFEAVVGGEVEVAGIEDGLLAEAVAEHAGLEVVDEDDAGGAAEELQGVLMAGEEVFGGLAAGELDVGHAAVAEDHDEEREAAAGGADLDDSGAAPVDLGGLAGGEGEAEEGGVAHGPHGAHVVFHDAEAAGVALVGAQALMDLGGAVGVAFEPAGDGGFEGIELAGALGGAAARVGGECGVFGGGFGIDAQFAADLAEAQAALLVEEADLAVGFVVDHFGTSLSMARRMSAAERTSPARGGGGGGQGRGGTGFEAQDLIERRCGRR